MGAREYMTENQLKTVENVGFMFAVTGNIPESSGLSSSSALVTAALMATLVGYGVSTYNYGCFFRFWPTWSVRKISNAFSQSFPFE